MITHLRSDPVTADDYHGPFLDVIKIWRTGMKDIIASMAKLCSTVGFAFDKKKCEEEVITLKDLPENLNVYLNETFEKRLESIELSISSAAVSSASHRKQIDDVRQNIHELCNQLLSHEIQAIFASLQNDNHYSIVDVFRNSDGDVLSVQDFLVRFSIYKLATVYLCGYISTRFPDMTISNADMFIIFRNGEGNSNCIDYQGHRLPSYQFAFSQAELHLNTVWINLQFNLIILLLFELNILIGLPGSVSTWW